jgi:hypothetical protein
VIMQISLPNDLQQNSLVSINGLSYLSEIGSNSNYNIFITTNDLVWRYSSAGELSEEYAGWAHFIYPGNTISYLSTSINSFGILDSSTAGIFWLKELSNFVLLPKNDTSNNYIGILASEIGLVIYNFKLTNNSFIAGAKSTRTALQNVAKSVISDMKINLYGQNIHVFTCSYSSQMPRNFYNGASCLQVINDNSNLVKEVYYLKGGVSTTDSPYYATPNSGKLNYLPSEEQVSISPVLLTYTNPHLVITSPKYSFKLANLTLDDILYYELSYSLRQKYYFPYIIERIISSISPAERNILTLADFAHYIKTPYLESMEDFQLNLIDFVDIENKTTIILPNTYAKKQTGPTTFVYTALLCIDYSSKVILPINDLVKDTKETSSGVFETTVVFKTPFSGRIYKTQVSTEPTQHQVSGLFKLISHNMGCYPQVILDASLLDKVNDIRYVDSNRLEVSFISEVNTTISLLG